MTEAAENKPTDLKIIDQLKTFAGPIRPVWQEIRNKIYTPHWIPTEIFGKRLFFLSQNLKMENNIKRLFNEAEYLGKILASIKPSDNVLDIGSYIGSHALFFATRAKSIYCVEPDPNFREEITRNAKKNNLLTSITIIPAAAWDKNQTLQLECQEMFWRSSRLKGTVNANDNPLSPRNFKSTIEVNGRTLDSIAYEIGKPIDIVKIDTEGAELHILKGGVDFWKNPPRIMAIEKHPGFLSGWGEKPEDVDQFMFDQGYQKTFESKRDNELLTIYSL